MIKISNSIAAARKLQSIGAFVLRYSLVFFLLLFGALKWTDAEARRVEPLIKHSPFLFWVNGIFGTQVGAGFIGVIEIAIGILIAGWHWSSRLSALGKRSGRAQLPAEVIRGEMHGGAVNGTKS